MLPELRAEKGDAAVLTEQCCGVDLVCCRSPSSAAEKSNC